MARGELCSARILQDLDSKKACLQRRSLHSSAINENSLRETMVVARQLRILGAHRLCQRASASVLALLGSVLLGGCSSAVTPPGDAQRQTLPSATAIVDLDRVAAELGLDEQMKAQLLSRQNEANSQLKQLQAQAEASYRQRRKQLGEELSAAEQEELNALEQSWAADIEKARQQNLQELGKFQDSLRETFHKKVRPICQEIAIKRGFGLVLTRNPRVVFLAQSSVDITQEVIKRLQKITSQDQQLTEGS